MKKLDKISWIGILTCVGLLFFSLNQSAKLAREQAERRAAQLEEAERRALEEKANPNKTEDPTPENAATSETATASAGPVTEAAQQSEEAEITTKDFRLTLTNKGAGIQTAELLKHKRRIDSVDEYVTLNETRNHPVGAFSSKPNEVDNSIWAIKEKSANRITFVTDTPEKLHIEKTFRIPDNDHQYEVEMDLSIRNDSGQPIELSETSLKYLYAGGAAPLHFGEWPMQIGLFYKEDRSTFRTKNVDFFGGGRKFLGVFGRDEKPYAVLPGETKVADNLSYAGVNNQFYATLIQSTEPVDGRVWADKYQVVIDGDRSQSEQKRTRGCEIAMSMPNLAMSPGDQKTLTYQIFMGPKEASILKQAKPSEREDIMNYDQIPIFGPIFGWAIKPLAEILAWCLISLEGIIGNYGVAIILLTILVRLLMWPVYAKSTRSMKRMSLLSPEMTKIKEKYPDDPVKVQKEVGALYKKYNINPVSGCLPMFLQLPVFLGFYRMLWGEPELRHESFLFVNDLTMPDNLAMIPGTEIPLNLLPILMSLASLAQIAITPKTGDSTQRIVFMLMPVLFLVICYNFASGLALYWTVSNVFTVAQTWIMNTFVPEPQLDDQAAEKKSKKKKGWIGKKMEGVQAWLEEIQQQALEQQQQGGKSGGSGGGGSKPKGQGQPSRKKGGGASAKKKSGSKKKKQPPGPQPGQSRTKLSSERGSRHTKSKKKRR